MSVSAVVVMGVSGSGKTTLGTALAHRLGWSFLDGDDLHPASNVAKMASGQPLDDDDRWPWLDDISRWIERNAPCVVACSALRRSYRDRLRREGLTFLYLDVPVGELTSRLEARAGHYMPASLLESQLLTLEPPSAEERFITLPVAPTATLIDDLARRVMDPATELHDARGDEGPASR